MSVRPLWKSAQIYKTGRIFSFASSKISQQYKAKGKGVTDVNVIYRGYVPFPSLLELHAHTLRGV